MKEIEEYLLKKYGDSNTVLTLCSRLIKKNIVYHLKNRNINCAIKIFFDQDKEYRFNNEKQMYRLFSDTQLIHTPKILDTYQSKFGPILIMEWIEGDSLKKELKSKEYKECLNDIKKMLIDMEKIWTYDIKKIPTVKIDELGITKRLQKTNNEIMDRIIINKPNIDFTILFEIYLELLNTVSPNYNYLINSDISAHEYIIKNNIGYWIDFEKYRIGNPNNDLARSFQSITNTFFKREKDVLELYDLYSKNKYFEEKIFLYYLTEKLMCSIHDAPSQITDEEIIFYTHLIKKKLRKKEN